MSKAAGAVVIHLAARGCISGESVMRRHRTRFAQFFLGRFCSAPIAFIMFFAFIAFSQSMFANGRRGGSMSDRNLPE